MIALLLLTSTCTVTTVCPDDFSEADDRLCFLSLTPTSSFCEANQQCVHEGQLRGQRLFLTGTNIFSSIKTENATTLNEFSWTSINKLLFTTSNKILSDANPNKLKRLSTTIDPSHLMKIKEGRNQALFCYLHSGDDGDAGRLVGCGFLSEHTAGSVSCELDRVIADRQKTVWQFQSDNKYSRLSYLVSRSLQSDSCHRVIKSKSVLECALR